MSLFTSAQPNKIGIIANAWAPYSKEKSLPYIEGLANKLQTLGFETVMVDLQKYEDRTIDLKQLLESLQGIWVTGGNSFYLNWAIHQSGFDTIVHDLVKNGLVYGGESAGAAVAGQTLHGVENLDDPAATPSVIWEGLGLMDFGIVPHWNNEKYASRLKKCRDEMEKYTKIATMEDDQYIVVS